MDITAVRGTRDILPELSTAFARLERVSREQAALWGFGEIRTPTFENLALFHRGIGDTTDIVEKEMYVFEDRGGRKLALRPEGTASAVRAYIENNLNRENKTTRLFYMGSMFRAERPQAGRYREFEQIGFEHFGDSSAFADAELILLASTIIAKFGVSNISISINSVGCGVCREPYKTQLRETLASMLVQLCDDCKRRYEKNPLRCLDCKTCSSLVREKAPAFTLCNDCQHHHQSLLKFLQSANLKFQEDPRLVRGLDYYTRTVYEITASGLGSQSAICGGGRYDKLVESLGGMPTPATGFAIGVDRVIESAKAQNAGPELKQNLVFLILADAQEKTQTYAFDAIQMLRDSGQAVAHSDLNDSMKSQLRQASKSGANFALMIGEQETMNQTAVLKNLATGEQSTVASNEIVARLTST